MSPATGLGILEVRDSRVFNRGHLSSGQALV